MPSISSIAHLLPNVRDVEGDFVEFGVYKGASSRILLQHAHTQNKILHLVDSFAGLPKPGEYDEEKFHEGRFAWKAEDVEKQLTTSNYVIHQDLLPESLQSDFWQTHKFSFIFVDVDHYLTTLAILCYSWAHLEPGGLLACHDYELYPDEILGKSARRAVNLFVETYNPQLACIRWGTIVFKR